ncbi:hypothetical protein HZC00_05270 [Candidatus Kaiserbacteria bacterium]|nr:hypothetical protein [Candidatus Kaiserbacteria bacterium]
MVVRKAVESLKARPHDERHAAAVFSALLVMAVLLVAWVVFFLKSFQTAPPDDFPNVGTTETPAQNASAAAAVNAIIHSTVTSNIGAQSPADVEATSVDTAPYIPSSAPTATPKDGSVADQLQKALDQ